MVTMTDTITIHISIHALRKESDPSSVSPVQSVTVFQSTLSVRRATGFAAVDVIIFDISIHALRKESDVPGHLGHGQWADISIHALRKESDSCLQEWCDGGDISIHALRKESDCRRSCDGPVDSDFNPRSP